MTDLAPSPTRTRVISLTPYIGPPIVPGYILGPEDSGPPPAPKFDSPYLTAEEATAYCWVALKTLYNHRSEIERMPGTGKLVFRVEALDKWLANRPKKKRRRI